MPRLSDVSCPAVLILCLAFLCNGATTVMAAEPDPVLKSMREALPPELTLSNEGRQLQLIQPLVPLPDSLEIPDTVLPDFEQFERIPSSSDLVFQPSEAWIADALRSFSADIQLGESKVDATDRERFAAAWKDLYEDSSGQKPTSRYKEYLDFKRQYDDLQEQLRSSQNPATTENIQGKIRDLKARWNFGNLKLDIEGRLSCISSNKLNNAQALFDSWKRVLESNPMGDYGNIWKSLTPGVWSSISYTVPSQRQLTTNVQTDSSPVESPNNIGELRIASISFRFALVPVPRQLVEHPFLKSRMWRHSKGLVLSDGIGGKNADSDLVLPRVVSDLVLIKDLEIRFVEGDNWRSVAEKMSAAKDVRLGVLPIKSDQQSAFLAPCYVSTCRPYVFGVVVTKVAKSPDPLPNLEWKEELP